MLKFCKLWKKHCNFQKNCWKILKIDKFVWNTARFIENKMEIVENGWYRYKEVKIDTEIEKVVQNGAKLAWNIVKLL